MLVIDRKFGGEGVVSEAPAYQQDALQLESFTLEPEAAAELSRIARASQKSPEELLGLALRALVVIADAPRKNCKVLITTRSGRPIKELAID